MAPITIAVLDDYAHVAPQYFSKIPGIIVDEFPETIVPSDSKSIDALVERLQPYSIISTMRERTPFRAELVNRLPNLKLLITTGLRNLAFDLDAAV